MRVAGWLLILIGSLFLAYQVCVAGRPPADPSVLTAAAVTTCGLILLTVFGRRNG